MWGSDNCGNNLQRFIFFYKKHFYISSPAGNPTWISIKSSFFYSANVALMVNTITYVTHVPYWGGGVTRSTFMACICSRIQYLWVKMCIYCTAACLYHRQWVPEQQSYIHILSCWAKAVMVRNRSSPCCYNHFLQNRDSCFKLHHLNIEKKMQVVEISVRINESNNRIFDFISILNTSFSNMLSAILQLLIDLVWSLTLNVQFNFFWTFYRTPMTLN